MKDVQRSETWKLTLVAVALIMITPGVVSMVAPNTNSNAPCCPHNVWGYAYLDGVPLEEKTLMAQIDGVTYGICNTYANGTYPPGLFSIDIWSDDTFPDNIKTGGYRGDMIIFAFREGYQTYYADYTATYELGAFNVQPIDFNFISDWPFELKINEVCTDDGFGSQYVSIYNPTMSSVNLSYYYLENGNTLLLNGTVKPGSDFFIDIGSTPFRLSSAGELKLVWNNQIPHIADGHDICVDRVEYGNLNSEPENTIMPDAVAPPAGWSIRRVPDGQDTDNCTADFRLRGALQTYDIQLNAGPNLISVPLEVEDECIICVLSSVDWIYAEWYDAFNSTDQWKTHLRTRPMPVNDFRAVNHTKGFWLTIPNDGTLTVTGNITNSTSILLKAGWNYVGYPSLTPKPISEALAGTGYDLVEGFKATAEYRLGPLLGSYMMKPGEGYRVHVPTDTLWIVDW